MFLATPYYRTMPNYTSISSIKIVKYQVRNPKTTMKHPETTVKTPRTAARNLETTVEIPETTVGNSETDINVGQQIELTH